MTRRKRALLLQLEHFASRTTPCEICRWPTISRDGAPPAPPVICSKCSMIALDQLYPDGSDPAPGKSWRERLEVKRQYRALTAS